MDHTRTAVRCVCKQKGSFLLNCTCIRLIWVTSKQSSWSRVDAKQRTVHISCIATIAHTWVACPCSLQVNEICGVKESDTGLAPPSRWDLVSDKQMVQEEQPLQVRG